MGINTSFVKIRVRPAEQTTLAGGNYYDLQLADGSMVRAFLEKPLWIPPTAETEAELSFPPDTENAHNLKKGEAFSLLHKGKKVAEGVILDARTRTISERK